MYTILVVILVLVSIALMGLIMLQQGKGADAGAAFGTGVSGTMFGNRGGGTLLSHITAGLATAFFVLTLALAYLGNHQSAQIHSVVDRVHAAQTQAATEAPKRPVQPKMQTGAPLVVPKADGNEKGTEAGQSPAAAAKTGEPRQSSGAPANGKTPAVSRTKQQAAQTGAPHPDDGSPTTRGGN